MNWQFKAALKRAREATFYPVMGGKSLKHAWGIAKMETAPEYSVDRWETHPEFPEFEFKVTLEPDDWGFNFNGDGYSEKIKSSNHGDSPWSPGDVIRDPDHGWCVVYDERHVLIPPNDSTYEARYRQARRYMGRHDAHNWALAMLAREHDIYTEEERRDYVGCVVTVRHKKVKEIEESASLWGIDDPHYALSEVADELLPEATEALNKRMAEVRDLLVKEA